MGHDTRRARASHLPGVPVPEADGQETIMKRITMTAGLLSLTALGVGPATAQDGHDLFQQALLKERAEGELEEAIQLYGQIVRDFATDRTLVATALVQMGQCYEKLGSTEAERAYRTVIRDFADLPDLVAQARGRLAALREPAPASSGTSLVARHLWGGTFAEGPDGGPDANGGPSPDGRYLAYVDWRTGDLALRDLVTGESRRLTDDGDIEHGGYAFEARFSPSGGEVAYAWINEEESYELRIVDLDGSPPRVLQRDSSWLLGFAWAHDGGRIARLRESPGGGLDLLLVSTGNASVTQLKHFDTTRNTETSFSPNDRYVTLNIPSDGDLGPRDIWLLATDGSGDAVPLIEHPADDWSVGWLPGTQKLLFVSDRSGTTDLWAVDVDEGEVSGTPQAVRRGVGDFWPLGFARDGSLFHAEYTRRFNTFVAPFDVRTGEIDLSRSEPLLGSNIGAIWSPDGAYLALSRQEELEGAQGTGEGLIIRNMATGDERRLAPQVDLGYARTEWSPDGRFILAYGSDGTGEAEGRSALWLVDVATRGATAVVDLPEVIQGIWTSDGRSIIYANRGRIVLCDLDSRRERELYRDPMLASRLIALSPDGQWLAVGVSTEHEFPPGGARIFEGGRILLVPVGGGAAQEVATIDRSGGVHNLHWSADGQHLFFWQKGDGTTLFRVHRDGGEVEEVWTTEDELGSMAHNPDGDRIAYTLIENDLDIWVMENLVAVLTGTGGGR